MPAAVSPWKAYTGPFLLIFCGLLLGGLVEKVGEGYAAWWLSAPEYWLYPLQTVAAGWWLCRCWGEYEWQWRRGLGWAGAVGVAVFLIWIAPAQWFGAAPRTEGYLPAFFGQPAVDRPLEVLRWLRLVVVVPLAEELFWRGFVLRYFIRADFTSIPVGTWQLRAFLIMLAGFCLEHQFADWPAAALAGALYGWVAIRTGSLGACVLAHAFTNALLGIWIYRTGQWGFW